MDKLETMLNERIAKVPYILDVLKKKATDNPDAVLLVDAASNTCVTRREVELASSKIYTYLKANGIGRECFVMIHLQRGVRPIIAMIGVMKAGAAYTIVEQGYPAERVEYIKKDFGCSAVIDEDNWDYIMGLEPTQGYEPTQYHDAAYAVYTSGTTGKPKGVLHEYGNVKLHVIPALMDKEKNDKLFGDVVRKFALISPLNFVASIKVILSVMYGDGLIYIIPYTLVKNPKKLMNYYFEEKITSTFLSPSMIRIVGDNMGPYLKIVYTGSEPANGIFVTGPVLKNTYAMSEGGYSVASFVIDKPYDVVPIGKPPIPYMPQRIVDEDGNDVPVGQMGELIFYNPFVRGYINLPEQTKAVFKDKMYYTGDLVRMDEDGNMYLLGRSNDMIKINGNRIEPAEIEACFKNIMNVDWCAARGFEKEAYIALYYKDELIIDEVKLREEMQKTLPYYMIPSFFIKVDSVPLRPNGKMDRAALPAPEVESERGEYVAPENELEERICTVFGKVLGIEKISATEDFFSIGGNSLKGMKVLAELSIEGLDAQDLFRERSARALSNYLKENESGIEVIDEMESRKKEYPLTAFQTMMFDAQLFTPKSTMWNFTSVCVGFDKSRIDADKMEVAMNTVKKNHPIFDTLIKYNKECELVQYFCKNDDKVVCEKLTEKEFEEILPTLNHPFKLLGKSMIELRLFETENRVIILILGHHIAIDGMGLHVLMGNICAAYAGQSLPEDNFYSFLESEERNRHSLKLEKSRKFFEEKYNDKEWYSIPKPDFNSRENEYGGIKFASGISVSELSLLEEKLKVSRNIMFQVVLLKALSLYGNKEDVCLRWVYHNRSNNKLKNTAGLLIRNLPMALHIENDMNAYELMQEASNQANDAIANSGYEWASKNDNIFKDSILEMVYEGDIFSSGKLGELGAKVIPLPTLNAASSMDFLALIHDTENGPLFDISYRSTLYKEESIKRFKECIEKSVEWLRA